MPIEPRLAVAYTLIAVMIVAAALVIRHYRAHRQRERKRTQSDR